MLARSFGCRVTCVEKSDVFAGVARDAAQAAGVDELVEVVQADGETFAIEPDRYDSALCLGATFIYGGLPETVTALAQGVRADGFVCVGEPYWLAWPLPAELDAEDAEYLPLAQTAAGFEVADVSLVTLIASSTDDWDRYVSLQWLAVEEWVHAHPTDPEAERFSQIAHEEKQSYLQWQRDLLGWGIFVGRKR